MTDLPRVLPKHVYNVKIDRMPRAKLRLKAAAPIQPSTLPPKVDLRPSMPDVYDQGALGSCTANALCGAVAFLNKNFMGSRLFVYYNERMLENAIPDDQGAYLYDGVRTLETHGVCPETDWPYDIAKFAVKPPPVCYTNALNHQVITSSNVNTDLNSMKQTLANGFPFVVAISIYKSFESLEVAKRGWVPMPQPTEESLGGHAVLVCGYDAEALVFIVRNSWGPWWGDAGYFYLPFAYLTNPAYSSDMWTITAVEIDSVPVPTPIPTPVDIVHTCMYRLALCFNYIKFLFIRKP